MRHMTPAELKTHLERATTPPLLLDVREPWEYQICHLPQARLLPMRDIPAAAGELDPATETVVICHHGVRSRAVAQYLERAGFMNVINLTGGMDAWARSLDPGMALY